jgi:hypothetical protein
MVVTAVTLREIEQIFEVIERFGISREAVVIPLRPASPGRVEMLANGKLEIVVDAAMPFEQWLATVSNRIGQIMGRGGN